MNHSTIEKIVLEIRNDRNFDRYTEFFKENPTKINELVDIVVRQAHYPLEEYASWILVHISKDNPSQTQQFYPTFVDILFQSKNQSVLRNITCCINQLQSTEYKESELFDLFLSFIKDHKNKVALHVYSMYALVQYVKKYPELKTEIEDTITHNSKGKTAAYKSALKKFQYLITKKKVID